MSILEEIARLEAIAGSEYIDRWRARREADRLRDYVREHTADDGTIDGVGAVVPVKPDAND